MKSFEGLERWLSSIEVELESSGALMEDVYNRLATLEGMGYRMDEMTTAKSTTRSTVIREGGVPHPLLPIFGEMSPGPVDPDDPKNTSPGKRRK